MTNAGTPPYSASGALAKMVDTAVSIVKFKCFHNFCFPFKKLLPHVRHVLIAVCILLWHPGHIFSLGPRGVASSPSSPTGRSSITSALFLQRCRYASTHDAVDGPASPWTFARLARRAECSLWRTKCRKISRSGGHSDRTAVEITPVSSAGCNVAKCGQVVLALLCA